MSSRKQKIDLGGEMEKPKKSRFVHIIIHKIITNRKNMQILFIYNYEKGFKTVKNY